MSQEPFVVVVIVSMNRCDDTLACLHSLRNSTYRNYGVIVLDVSSGAQSIKAIRQGCTEVKTIELIENRGYAGNNNIGIEAALAAAADWVLLLNDDTLVGPDCLSRLVEAAEQDPRIGFVGPMVYHYDEPRRIQSAGGKLAAFWRSAHLGQNEEDRGQFREPHAVEWISGCGIMARRALIEQIGVLDERYFLYWEETEWCIRARRRGWRVIHVPQAKLWHKGVQRDYRPSPSVTYYATRNRLLTLAKHRAPWLIWLGTCLQMARTLTSWTVRPKWRPLRQHRDAMWLGITDFLRRRWGQMPET